MSKSKVWSGAGAASYGASSVSSKSVSKSYGKESVVKTKGWEDDDKDIKKTAKDKDKVDKEYDGRSKSDDGRDDDGKRGDSKQDDPKHGDPKDSKHDDPKHEDPKCDPKCDPAQAVTLTISDATAQEGNVLVFDLELSGPSQQAIVFRLDTASGTATETSDFDSIDGTFVTFAPGETMKTVSVQSTADQEPEGQEIFTLSAVYVPSGGGDDPKDDDPKHGDPKGDDHKGGDDHDGAEGYGPYWGNDGGEGEKGKKGDNDDDHDGGEGHGKGDGCELVVVVANDGTGTIIDSDVVALHIEKSASVPGGTADQVGELITYTYLVTNVGTQPIANVVVTDDNATPGQLGDDFNPVFQGGDGNGNSLLDVGETWTYAASRAVTQDHLDAGDAIVNVAVATGNGADPVSDDASVTVSQNPLLDIVKSVDGVEGVEVADEEGDLIVYNITVANIGNVTLHNVTVTDPNADAPPARGADLVGDNDDDFEVGETWSFTATHTVTQAELDDGGDIVNVATADSDESPPDSDDASVPVTQTLALSIVKQGAVQDGVADEVGDLVNYTIAVSNAGNAAIANVTVVDPFVSNLMPVLNAGFNVGDTDQDGLLDVGETWQYTATHLVTQDELDAGDDIYNVATASGTGADEVSDDASVEVVQNRSLRIVKDAEVQDGTADQIGDLIIYTYTVTNTGNAAIANVTVVDDAATPGVPGDDFNPTFVGGDTDNDNLLDVGETWTYSATYALTAEDLEGGGSIVNVATVSGDSATGDSDDATIPLDPQPIGGTASATVFEAGNERVPLDTNQTLVFPEGTQHAANGDPGEIENASGNLGLNYGADGPNDGLFDRFEWTTVVARDDADGDGSGVIPTVMSGGFPVNWVPSNDGETLQAVIQGGPNDGEVVAELTVTFSGSGGGTVATYHYNQIGPFDHSEPGQSGLNDTIRFDFGYTIHDASGDAADGVLRITVADDRPVGLSGASIIPGASLVKAEAVDSGATGTNMAFVVDVSDSTVRNADGSLVDVDPAPGIQSRLSVEIAAIKSVLQQAIDNNVFGPVLLVAFHGNWTGGSNVGPRTFFETYASAGAALAAVDGFFAALGGPPFGALNGAPPQPGSTRWEGGLDVAADWYTGVLTEDLPEDDGLPVGNGFNPVIQPGSVALSDNRIFFITDGGNNNAAGGFTPNPANLPPGSTSQEVARLYTNISTLSNDIPNLTIRTVAILNGDQNNNGTADAIEYASIVDQSDDNLVNGSVTIVNDAAGISGIVAGFGVLQADTTASGNLFEDDDLIGGPGQDGIVPILGADGFKQLLSFTYTGPDSTNQPDDPDANPDIVTVMASGTFMTALGGTITVDFTTGDYSYTAPTGAVTGTDSFSYVMLDGDGDPLNGVLNILVGIGGTAADNAGFETDTLIFWHAAGAVWVEQDSKYSVSDALTEGSHVAVIHTGNSLASELNNTEITPDSDRTPYDNATLVGFINQPGLATLNNAGGIASPNGSVLDGSVLKGVFAVENSGSVDVRFDWQFLTDHGINAGTSQNDIAFVVVEGQLFLLANSDNLGTPLGSVLAAQNVTIDSQTFTNATTFHDNQLLTNIADAGNDGIINVAFGVVNAGATANSASALIIDDVHVVPHV